MSTTACMISATFSGLGGSCWTLGWNSPVHQELPVLKREEKQNQQYLSFPQLNKQADLRGKMSSRTLFESRKVTGSAKYSMKLVGCSLRSVCLGVNISQWRSFFLVNAVAALWCGQGYANFVHRDQNVSNKCNLGVTFLICILAWS